MVFFAVSVSRLEIKFFFPCTCSPTIDLLSGCTVYNTYTAQSMCKKNKSKTFKKKTKKQYNN